MSRWAVRSSLLGLAVSLLWVVPVSGASAVGHPGMSVSGMPQPALLANSGELRLWGEDDLGQGTVPVSLRGVAVSQAVRVEKATLALTAAGRVVGWGGGYGQLQRVPAAVSGTAVAKIATAHASYAGVVTRDGRVLTWGIARSFSTPLNVPAGLGGVKDLALAMYNAAAVKSDGSVVAWGRDAELNAVPAGLRAKAVVSHQRAFYALTTEGTVVGWGMPDSGVDSLPASVSVPGNVKAIAVSSHTGLALLADGTVATWGMIPTLPSSLAGVTPVAMTGGINSLAIVDSEGAIHQWSTDGGALVAATPAANDGQALAYLAVSQTEIVSGAAVVTKMLRAVDPVVSGRPVVGGVLVAAAGTFSGTPDAVSGQWLVNNVPVAGVSGNRLVVSAGMVGKKIAYRSTAVKAGEATVSSESVAVVGVKAPPVVSRVVSVAAKATKKAAVLTVSARVTAVKSPVGRATVTVRKGSKVIVVKSVGVASSGVVKLRVAKFGRLVLKKTKSKKKTGYRGKYTVTVAYSGNADVKASSVRKAFTVKR